MTCNGGFMVISRKLILPNYWNILNTELYAKPQTILLVNLDEKLQSRKQKPAQTA
jgi:hypothetical protein